MSRYLLFIIFLIINIISCQISVLNITITNDVHSFSPFHKNTVFTIKVNFNTTIPAGNTINYSITSGDTDIGNQSKTGTGESFLTFVQSSSAFFNGSRLYPQQMNIRIYSDNIVLSGSTTTTLTYNSPYYQLGVNTTLTFNIVDNVEQVAKLGVTNWVGLLYVTFNQINLYKYCFLLSYRDLKPLKQIAFSYGNNINTVVFFPIPNQVSTESFNLTDISPSSVYYSRYFQSAIQNDQLRYEILYSTYGSYFYFITNTSVPIGDLRVKATSTLQNFINPIYYNDILGNYISYLPIKNTANTYFEIGLGTVDQTIPFEPRLVSSAMTTAQLFTSLGNLVTKPKKVTQVRAKNNYFGALLTYNSPSIYLFESVKVMAGSVSISETIPLLMVPTQSIVTPLLGTTSNVISIVGNYLGNGNVQYNFPVTNLYTQGSEINYPSIFENGIKNFFKGDYTPMVYYINFDVLSVEEAPLLNTFKYGLFLAGSFLPFKTVSYDFPYRCSGFISEMSYNPFVPILPDTPNAIMKIEVVDGISHDVNMIFNNLVTDDLDLLHPMAKLLIVYDNDTPTGKSDYLIVNIFDKIGIDNDRCFVKYGPNVFKLSHDLRYKGTNSGDQSYITSFTMNRYFCDQDVIFECEDLRGSSVSWSSSELKGSVVHFLTKFNDCDSPLGGVKLVSLNVNNYYDSTTYTKAFQVVLFAPNSDQSSYGCTLYLDDINTGQNLYSVFLTYNSTSNSFSQTLGFFNVLTQNCNFRLQLTYQSKGIEFSNSDLRYINKINPKVEVSVQLVESTFTGFPFYGNQISITQTAGVYYLSFNPPALFSRITTVSYVLITSLYPYPTPGKLVVNTTEAVQYPIVIVPDVSHRIYIETICDIGKNCITYPSYAFTSAVTAPVALPAKINMKSAVYTMVSSPNIIDVTSQNRKVKFTFYFTPSFQILTSPLPILYLIESTTMHKLTIPFIDYVYNGTTYTFTGEYEIPLNWGTNGLFAINIYNVFSYLGQFEGYEIPTHVFTLIHQPGPVIWNTFIDTSEPDLLYLYGANLGYVDLPEHSLSIYQPGKPNITNLNYSPLSSSKGVVRFLKPLSLQSDTYLVVASNPNLITLFILGCINEKCSGNGYCENGLCKCNSGWDGLDCSINTNYQCKNNCSSNGQCVQMNCNCNAGFMGPTCETKIVDNNQVIVTIQPNNTTPVMTFNQFSSNTTTTSDTTSTSTPTSNTLSEESKKTNFTVLLTKIEEFDYHNNLKFTYDLLGKWTLQSFNSTTYIYTMPLTAGSMLTVIVEMTASESKNIEFANTTITIPSNSIKYYIKLERYKFQSSLNHLTYTWEANYKSPNPCQTKDQKIQYGGSNLNDIHYIIIPANQLQLYGRFSNSIILDDRILLSSNQAQVLKEKVTIKVNVPYFQEQVELDPDFSVLVNLDSQVDSDSQVELDDQCNPISIKSDKGLPKYAIPVIIVGSIAVATILLSIIFTLLYKKNMTFRLKVLSIKQFSRSKSSKTLKMNKF